MSGISTATLAHHQIDQMTDAVVVTGDNITELALLLPPRDIGAGTEG